MYNVEVPAIGDFFKERPSRVLLKMGALPATCHNKLDVSRLQLIAASYVLTWDSSGYGPAAVPSYNSSKTLERKQFLRSEEMRKFAEDVSRSSEVNGSSD